ncbi:hypothetical protein ACROYT_G021818 [Oculina patagonica]
MARKGGIGGKKDRLFINNVIANGKEDFQLSSKLANLELQKHKEIMRWDTEKNKLSLPSLKTNGGISLTPPSSPTTSPTRSPVVQRRRSELLATEAAARLRGNNQMIVGSDVVGLRRSKSSQNIRLSVGPKPPPSPVCRSPGAVSPRLLHRRSTISQGALFHDEGNALKEANMGRRFSAGVVVPSIRVEESAESLNEKVKKFNESLQKFSKEANRSKNNTNTLEDDAPTTDESTDESTDELLIPPRPVAHRWKSLPNIFPMLGSNEKSPEEMTFYEDMKRFKSQIFAQGCLTNTKDPHLQDLSQCC